MTFARGLVEFLWSRLLFYSLWFSILCLILGIIETTLLIRKGGTKLKRGFKIYGRPLTIKEKEFLQALNEDIFTKDKIFLGTFDRGFIRQKNSEYLIRSRSYDWRTAWPYVGYVNLAQPNPELQYRISLFMHLALMVTVVSGVGILFTGPVMYINFRSETGNLNEYLQNLIDNHLEPKQTES